MIAAGGAADALWQALVGLAAAAFLIWLVYAAFRPGPPDDDDDFGGGWTSGRHRGPPA